MTAVEVFFNMALLSLAGLFALRGAIAVLPHHEAKQLVAVPVVVAVTVAVLVPIPVQVPITAVSVPVPVAAPPVVVVPGSGMILLEFAMQIPQRPVIGAVLIATVEALLMGALMSFVDVVVQSVVCPMVALMLIVVVVIIVRERHRGGCRQRQNGCSHQYFADSH